MQNDNSSAKDERNTDLPEVVAYLKNILAEERAREKKIKNQSKKHFSKGCKYLKSKSYDLAIDEFTKTIESCPDNALAYDKRGIAYGEKGDYDKAIADFSAAIEIDNTLEGPYNNRGASYDRQSIFDKAISDYSRAIGLKPDVAMFYYSRGLAYYYSDEYAQALADFSTALMLDSDNSETYSSRGEVYATLGLYDKAIADFKAALDLNPADTINYGNLVWLRKVKLEEMLKRMVAISPENEELAKSILQETIEEEGEDFIVDNFELLLDGWEYICSL